MKTNNRKSKTSFRSGCWIGHKEDLQNLVDVFLDLQDRTEAEVSAAIEQERKAQLHEFERQRGAVAALFADRMATEGIEQLEGLLKNPNLMRDFSRYDDERRLQWLQPRMTATYKEMETKDTDHPSKVMERLRVRQVREVELEYGATHNDEESSVYIELTQDGCRVKIAGDEMTVNGMENRLKQLLRQQRPYYWWLRSNWFLIPFVYIAALALTGYLFLLIDPSTLENDTWWGGVAWMGVFVGLWTGFRWLIPSFELVRDNRKSRSQWAFAPVGAIALSVIAGLITPLFQ